MDLDELLHYCYRRSPFYQRKFSPLARSITGSGALIDAFQFIPPLLYAAAAAGADGFFLETHPDPDHAPSDGPNMLPLEELPGIVSVALEVWQRAREALARA